MLHEPQCEPQFLESKDSTSSAKRSWEFPDLWSPTWQHGNDQLNHRAGWYRELLFTLTLTWGSGWLLPAWPCAVGTWQSPVQPAQHGCCESCRHARKAVCSCHYQPMPNHSEMEKLRSGLPWQGKCSMQTSLTKLLSGSKEDAKYIQANIKNSPSHDNRGKKVLNAQAS